MLVPAELIRAAGNVLLTPVELSSLPDSVSWRRASFVGSRERAVLAAAEAELHAAVPHLEAASGPAPADVVCLLLTGEGLRREKITALRSRAALLLARGRTGQWYRVNRPASRPADLGWWGRALAALCLIFLYWLWLEFVLFCDLLWRFRPRPRPIADPGPANDTRVTFIVPTYNQRALMDFCLPALLKEAAPGDEIIVVDDAGSDDTADYVRNTYPSVRVVRLETNQGFAGAVRAGIAASTTPLFALINNDAQVRPGFSAALRAHFAEAHVFAVCSRIELPEGSQVETGRVAAAFSGILEPYHLPPTDGPAPILYAGGASSLFHRARFDALGGFSTLYHPFYWEDIELGYRAWRVGWRSVFEPSASVLHQRRATIGPRFGEEYADQTFLKNALLFVLKNIRDRRLLSQHLGYVAMRLLLELPAGTRMMSGAVRRAAPLFWRALRERWRERRRGDLSDREIMELLEPLRTRWDEGVRS